MMIINNFLQGLAVDLWCEKCAEQFQRVVMGVV